MLTVIQPPINFALLAWISLVPFILACLGKSKTRTLIITAYLVSFCYWLGNLYWIGYVTWLGWIGFCLYTALLWPMLILAIRYCKKKNIPLFITVAILLVGTERLQGFFFGGFYWRHLSHSQYANISLIQIADIFGAAGLSFLIAMVNALIAELIIAFREKNIFKVSNFLKTAFVGTAIIAAIAYGEFRLKQTDELIEVGPLVAAVQSNVPQSVKDSGSMEENNIMLRTLLENSKASIQAGAELVVWPETMVPGVLDKRILRVLTSPSYHIFLDKNLRDHAKENCYLLVGAMGGTPEFMEDGAIEFSKKYNSAFLYQPDGTQANQQYNKIHLVPFGEVIPFRDSCEWMHNFLMKFTPYDYDYTLDAGTEYTIFKIKAANKPNTTYKFSVLICYEDTIPKIARKFAIDNQGRKRIDWLVNISNDGWFVKFREQKSHVSTELAQHTAICVFRSVENRLAVLRSVNTGISCLIDTAGRIKNEYFTGNLPKKSMERTGITGWFADKMPIDTRVTVFSRYGQWLDISCAAVFVLIIMISFAEPRFIKFRNKSRKPSDK